MRYLKSDLLGRIGSWASSNLQLLFVMPAVVLLCLLIVLPFIVTLVLSLLNYSPVLPYKDGEFIGLANYARAFQDETFLRSLYLTFKFAVLSVGIGLLLAGVISLWLNAHPGYARVLLPILILPSAFPPVIVALLWKYSVQSDLGAFTYFIKTIIKDPEFNILGNAGLAFNFTVLVDIWQWTPVMTLVLLVGLLHVNKSSIEAARIDGASEFRIFADVVLNQLKPYIIVIVILRILECIKVFDKIYVLTGGGPGTATELLNVYLWRTNFKFWDNGYGAALSVLAYLLTLSLLLISFKKLKYVLRWD